MNSPTRSGEVRSPRVIDPRAFSWVELNTKLMQAMKSEEVLPYLRGAVAFKVRPLLGFRIYQRFNRLREQEDLKALSNHTMPESILAVLE